MKKLIIYIRDFSLTNLLFILSLVTIIYLTREYVYLGINKFIIVPFGIDDIKSNFNLDFLCTFIVSGSLIWLSYILILKHLLPCINSIVNIILVSCCYILVIRFSNVFYLEPIKVFPIIKYLDVLFYCILLISIKFKYYHFSEKSESIYGFIEDDFNPQVDEDILGRRIYAGKIGLKILGTKPLNKAFVIAINSPWGYGKSGFLHLIEEFFKGTKTNEVTENTERAYMLYNATEIKQLALRATNTIIVRYNPWKNFDDKKIVQDFFDELSISISKYDLQLSKR
ncbi:MAG: hypothetical protein IPM91_08745 [Bacteroidetes bacterium]|nr:hypothetical protein [Bacteroidota bacterium]